MTSQSDITKVRTNLEVTLLSSNASGDIVTNLCLREVLIAEVVVSRSPISSQSRRFSDVIQDIYENFKFYVISI
jgi:hypothetical protein